MKKFVLAVIAGIFLNVGRFVWAESDVNASPMVKVMQHEGEDDAYLGPEYFPDFYKNTGYRSAEKSCADYLTNTISKEKLSAVVDKDNGLKGGEFLSAKNCRYACPQDKTTGSCDVKRDELVSCGSGSARGIDVESGKGKNKLTAGEGDDWDLKDDYYDLDGLSGSLEIDSGYKELGKALFTWTVRVEGNIPEDCDHAGGARIKGISVWPVLCHPWHGKSYQRYDGGQVKTQLYVKGVKETDADGEYKPKDKEDYIAVGEPVEMTVPLINSKVTVGSGSDPTLTGSYVLIPGDFSSGAFPDKIEYKLKWANHTALRLKSPAEQRNLVVTLMPLTEEK